MISILTGLLGVQVIPAQEQLILDNFASPRTSTFGTNWEGFTDRVMGGITTMRAELRKEGADTFLRMEGQVRLENNGGFLQMRLPLLKDGRPLDARPWTGIRVVVRGLPGSYAVHLRSAQNWLPWNFYTSPLSIGPTWTEVRLPFSTFKGDYGAWGTLEIRTLRSVALVAIGKAFTAQLDVREIGLY